MKDCPETRRVVVRVITKLYARQSEFTKLLMAKVWLAVLSHMTVN